MRALADPLLRPQVHDLLYDRAVRRRRRAPDRPRRGCGRPTSSTSRPACRETVLECETKFSTTDVAQPPDVVRRVLRDVPRRVVERGLGARRRQADVRDARRSSTALPGRHAAAALGPARLLRATACIPRNAPASAREAAQGPARRARTKSGSYPRSVEHADDVLRLAAAGAPRAGQRPDLHGLRRPRRHRRLEHRARLARPGPHDAARPPRSSPTRSSPTRSSRTGATTRCATARTRTQARARTQAAKLFPATGAATPTRLVRRAREALRPQPARPRDRRAAAQVALVGSTARATAWSRSTRARAAASARATCRPGCCRRRRSRSSCPTRRATPLPAGHRRASS